LQAAARSRGRDAGAFWAASKEKEKEEVMRSTNSSSGQEKAQWRRPGFIAVIVLICIAAFLIQPALAQDVIEPGTTASLLPEAGDHSTDVTDGQTAAADADAAAATLKAEADTLTTAGASEAHAVLYKDFQIAADGGTSLSGQLNASVDWNGFFRVENESASVDATLTLTVENLGTMETLLERTVHKGGTGSDACLADPPSCVATDVVDSGSAQINEEISLTRGETYRLALSLDLMVENDGGMAQADYMDMFLDQDNGGVRWLDASLKVEPDLFELLTEINMRLQALEQQAQAANMKLDALDGKVDALDGKVDVLDGKVDALSDKADAIQATLDILGGGIEGLRAASCDLERLVSTPEGQRASDLAICADQPGYPYDFPEPRLDSSGTGNDGGTGNDSGNGNGNDNGNGNGNGNDDGNGNGNGNGNANGRSKGDWRGHRQ
jgi:hypothetical protein